MGSSTQMVNGTPLAHGAQRVSTDTEHDQCWPEIALLRDGGYVVVWHSSGQDGSGYGVYFQRFAANGTALGSEVRANTSTVNSQWLPQVTGLSDGGFVIVWDYSDGYEGAPASVVAQRYNSDGVAQGPNFLVNTRAGANQGTGMVAGYEGGFAAVWRSSGNPGDDGFDIYLKLFDNAGNTVLGDRRVSEVPGQPGIAQRGDQWEPYIAARDNGDLVIVWNDSSRYASPTSGLGVYGRLWNAAQQTFSDTFRVNTTTTGSQSGRTAHHEPSVAMLADGGFVVVWPADRNDGSSWDVMGQRFDAQGHKLGDEFRVNQATARGQFQASVTGLSTGGFAVTFFSEDPGFTDPRSGYGSYIREYDAVGNALGGQRKVMVGTTDPLGGAETPAIADLGNGNFVVAYTDYVPEADGGTNRWGIMQERFASTKTMTAQHHYQFIGDTYFEEEFAVGPGVDLATYHPFAFRDLDVEVTPTGFTFGVGINSTFTFDNTSANSLRIIDTGNGFDRIVGVDLVSTTVPGFTADRLSFEEDSITLRFGGLSVNPAHEVLVNVDTVPAGPTAVMDIVAAADTMISEAPSLGFGSVAQGSLPFLYLIEPSGWRTDTLIRFDLGAVNRQLVGEFQTVSLNFEGLFYSLDMQFSVYPILSSWDEGSTTYKNFSRRVGPAVLTDTVVGADLSANDKITLRLPTSLVQSWMDFPGSNHGILLTPNTGRDLLLSSREAANTANPIQGVAPTLSIQVINEAPVVTLGGSANADEGSPYVLAIDSADADNAELNLSVDWGDGSPYSYASLGELRAAGGQLQHVFVDDQDGLVNGTPRTVTVMADDGEGGVGVQTRSVVVRNVSPDVLLDSSSSVVAGSAFELTVGATSDPGQDTITSLVVDWGDGVIETLDVNGAFSHVYSEAGERTVAVSLRDEDGLHQNVATRNVQVLGRPASLSMEAGADATIIEGDTLGRTIAFSDGEDSDGDGWAYTIDYGDGTVVHGRTLEAELHLNHVYEGDAGQRTVNVTVRDSPPNGSARNLVANGSFESGSYNNLDADPRPSIMLVTPGMTSLEGWQVLGARGVHWIDEGPLTASQGNRYVDLQGEYPFGELSRLQTTFATTPGEKYRLSFDSFRGDNSSNAATVSVGTLQNQAFVGPRSAGYPPIAKPFFQTFEYDFTATSSSSVLSFVVTQSDGFGPNIDNVSVTALEFESVSDSFAVTITDRPTYSTSLALPTSLAPGEEGSALLSYTNNSGEDQSGILVFVKSQTALLRDPLTGQYSDSLLLIGRGDGEGPISADETGTLGFTVRQANGPSQNAGITLSVADQDSSLDAAALSNALRPTFSLDAAWQRVSTNFVAGAGSSTQSLVEALADNSALIAGLGANGTSGVAALAFELEQAGDFGSIAERAAAGSLGDGWAFIGDVKLEIAGNGDVAWRGSTDLGALFTLNPASAAHYIVSSSVELSVGMGGGTSGAVPPNRPVFTRNIDGSYSADTAFGGDLVKVAGGYEVRTPGGAVLRFGSDGRLTEVVSSTGRAVEVTHDAQGRISGFAGDFNNTLTIERDASGRATALVDEYGQTTTLGYTAGRLTQATTVAGTATFAYGAAGDLASATPAGGPATGFAYDSQGRVTAVVHAGETAATVAYDSRGGYTLTSAEGQQTQVELKPGGVAAKVSTGGVAGSELVYDASGKLVGAQLADGSQVQFGIDDQGRLVSVTDPTGAILRYGYDDDSTRPSSFTDATGTTRQFSYDANGRMVQATWGDGTSLQFNYDAQGQISGYTNRRGDATTYQYDANGQLISRSEASDDTTYTYDSLGRLVAATTGAGTLAARTTEVDYDGANRVTRIEYPDGRSLDYGYDAAGRRTAMTDQDGNVQSYSYDTAGRLATVSYNGNQVVGYHYDGDGRLTEESNGNGTSTAYSYDERGQLTAIVNLAPDDTETSAYRYSYDIAGQRVGMQTPQGAWAYGYDAAGQLTSAQFTVNTAGTAAGLANKSLVYAYDAAGNRTSVTEDGVQTLYASNALNQYTQVGNATFTYDADGNQISKTVDGQTWTYAYNAANRLVQITGPQGETTQYEYDVLGNRSAVVEDGVRTEFLVDPFSLGMGSAVAEYSNGQRLMSTLYGLNAIAQQDATGTYYFDGDAVGSVTSITGAAGAVANRYVYDPFGRQLLEAESVDNRLEFNGLFGVEEADAGLTFMRARFYDPEQGRFTAEDPLWLSGDVASLYRFVTNAPLAKIDPSGESEEKVRKWIEFSQYDRLNEFVENPTNEAGKEIDNFNESTSSVLTDGGKADAFSAAKGVIPFYSELYSWLFGKGLGAKRTIPQIGSAEIFKETLERETEDELPLNTPFRVAGEVAFGGASDGDPHLRTFDGLSYDFQAAGEFVLARGTDLEIQTRQEPWSVGSNVSVNTAAAMRVGDAVVGIYVGQNDVLNINGNWVPIADGETLSVGGGSVHRDNSEYIVTDPNGDGFWAGVYAPHLINVRPFLRSSRGGDVAGLLGNNDGSSANDLALPDGTVLANPVPVTELYGQFADAWRITDTTSLFVYGAGESTASFTDRSFPPGVVRLEDLDPAARAAAEQVAIAAGLVPGTWEFDGAVLDVALTNNPAFAAAVAAAPTAGPQPTPVVLQLPPNVVADVATTREDEAVTIDVLANDSDPENDALQIVGASDPNGGTVGIVEDRLLFTPAADFNGSTELRYTVSDGAGNRVTGTVAVTIEAVNDAPVAVSDNMAVTTGRAISLTAGELLRNDRDVDGDPIAISEVGVAAHGTVIWAEGVVSYASSLGFVGVDTISYQITDGFGGVSTAQIVVNVLAEEFDTIRLGDAPQRQTGFGGQWQAAWSNPAVTSITHKADALAGSEPWSAASFSGASPNVLSGLDVFQGDLGVSGQSLASSTVRQELDGAEVLRIDLAEEAQSATLQLSRFALNDDGSLLAEAGLLRLIDANGGVVGETAFVASNASGTQQVAARGDAAFVAIELWAGAYDGEDFVFGARVGEDGHAVASAPSGNAHTGSEFMLDWVEFDFPVNVIGVPVVPTFHEGGS